MSIFNRFRRQKEDPELARKALLLRQGRIADGSVLDIGTDAAGATTHIFYHYVVSGVEYESSQTLDSMQSARPDDYAPGSRIIVRYDPRYPANSIVA